MVRYGRDEPPAYPPGCTPLAVDLPRHARGPLHGPRAQPAARLRARRPGLPARRGHLGRHAGHARAGLPLAGPQGAAGVLGRRAAGVEHARSRSRCGPRSDAGATATTRSSSASGPNGLTAAVTLARGGRSVLVRRGAPRRSAARRRPPSSRCPAFTTTSSPPCTPPAIASPVFAELELERHGLRWIQPELAMVHPLPGGRGAIALARPRRTVAQPRRARARRRRGAGRSSSRRTCATSRPCAATMLAGFPPVAGPARLIAALKLAGHARVRAPAAHVGRGARRRDLPRRRRRLAVRLVAARRRAAGRRGQRDRRRLAQPARPRRRLAEPGGRRRRASPARWRAACTSSAARRARRAGAERVPRPPRPRARRRARRRRADRGAHRRRDDDAARARRARRRRARRRLRAPRAALSLRPADGQARLGARRADPVGERGRAAGRHGPRRRHAGTSCAARCTRSRGGRLPEQPFLLSRPADDRRPDARARRQAHRLGLHAHARRASTGRRERERVRRRDRAPDRALRARLSRPRPRPPRHGARRPAARATRASSAATSATAATRWTSSSSARCRR